MSRNRDGQRGAGVKIIMSGLRHVNIQDIGADSSVVFGESISNPAYLETNPTKRQGMLIERVRIYPSLSDPFKVQSNLAHQVVHQLQSGALPSTPVILECEDSKLIANAMWENGMSTAVGFQTTKLWPMDMEAMAGTPVIVTPQFCVVHDFDINDAAYQSKEVNTVIDYSIAEIDSDLFATLLLNQQRTS